MEVPAALAHLIAVNVEYKVLLCLGRGCQRAVRPAALLRHVRDQKHPISKAARKEAHAYVQACPYDYDHASIALPADGLAPQPIIPIVDGFQCQQCPFRRTSRKAMKVHGNKAHAIKRVADDALFQRVRLQTWFWDGKERYWAVDESQQAQQERQARRAAIADVGEESGPGSGSGSGSGSDSEDS
jgi:hypothetical protein